MDRLSESMQHITSLSRARDIIYVLEKDVELKRIEIEQLRLQVASLERIIRKTIDDSGCVGDSAMPRMGELK